MRIHDITVYKNYTSEDLKLISTAANQFGSSIVIKKDQSTVDVKSILGMMLFKINKGAFITVQTQGKDEEEALEFMCRIFEKP